MSKNYYVYMITNKSNTVIYAGVSSDLKKRVYEHKSKLVKGFTSKYHVEKLVWYETCDDSYQAITRERQIKAGSRQKKIALIESFNPTWEDLYEKI